MTEQERRELAIYRLTKAKETLAEVDYHLQNALWNTAINRLYYACFYAAGALLVSKDISTKTHAGTKQQLGFHFILTGMVPKAMGSYYSELFDMRQSSDYEDFVEYERKDVVDLIGPATAFINKAEEILAI